MTDFDKKWMFYLCVVLAITFLVGRAGYWAITYLFGVSVVNESGEAVLQLDGILDVVRNLLTPVLMVGGTLVTSSSYLKHRDNDTE